MAANEVGHAVELRACNRMHGVLVQTGARLTLTVKRGDLLIIYDLAETLRQQRPVFVVRVLSVDGEE